MNRFWVQMAAILLAFPPTAALAGGDPEEGGRIALRWCAACHVVAEGQASAASDAPTFRSVAQKYQDNSGVLAAFLADPHPVMPNMSLTRQEIQDLVAYFASLR